MSQESEIRSSQELRRKLIERLQATKDVIGEGSAVAKMVDEGIRRLNEMPPNEICPPEMRKMLLSEINSLCELAERGKDKTPREAMQDQLEKKMTKEQLKAQLLSAREQAEMNMPSLLSCLDGLSKDLGDFDDACEGKQAAMIGAIESWVDFVQKSCGDSSFEDNIQQFRKMVEVGDGENRTLKDTALLAYATMYAVDFASVFCSIEGGVRSLSEDSSPEEIMSVTSGIIGMVRNNTDTAKYFLQSIGIASPQGAIVQLEWLQKIVLNKAKAADMPFAFAEIKDGKVHMMKPTGDDDICWKKRDDD